MQRFIFHYYIYFIDNTFGDYYYKYVETFVINIIAYVY